MARSTAETGLPNVAAIPRGGAGGEERLALDRGRLEELSEQGAERAAGRDDRAFGPERAAGSDRDRGGERFQKRHPRRDPALVEQDLFHRFGNPVSANRLASRNGP